MNQFYFRIPQLNEQAKQYFEQIKNDSSITPNPRGSRVVVMFFTFFIALLLAYYLFLGLSIVILPTDILSYFMFVKSLPIWGVMLFILFIANPIASFAKNVAGPVVVGVVNLLFATFIFFITPLFISLPCIGLLVMIAINLFRGCEPRMMKLLTTNAGPYQAIIVDNNQQQLLLENLNKNQLCCVDELCEALKQGKLTNNI